MTEEMTRQQILSKADAFAYRKLREANQGEFNKHKRQYAAQNGVEWSPRLTGKDKARSDLARLLSENPDLRSELVKEIEEQVKNAPEF